jgi:hypothetical protein
VYPQIFPFIIPSYQSFDSRLDLSITFASSTKKVPIGAFLNVYTESAKGKPLGPTIGEGSLPNRRWIIPGNKVNPVLGFGFWIWFTINNYSVVWFLLTHFVQVVFGFNHSADWDVKCVVVAHTGSSTATKPEGVTLF